MMEDFSKKRYTEKELLADILTNYIYSLVLLFPRIQKINFSNIEENIKKYIKTEEESYLIFLEKNIKDSRVTEIHNLCEKLKEESNIAERLKIILFIKEELEKIKEEIKKIQNSRNR